MSDLPTPPSIPDYERYSRQILFPGIAATGQQLLAASHVAIVGVGATGAATSSLLARAGVGTLTLIDRDFVEPSNLQRQILFDEEDALDSRPKAEAARRKIALFNSNITVHARIADLVPANIHDLLASADLVLDATDNFETRYLLNDFCVQQSKPWIYAAAIGAYAATMTILPATSFSSNESVILSDGGKAAESKNPCISSLRGKRSDVPVQFGASPTSSSPPPTPLTTHNSQLTTHNTPTACLACIFPKPPTGPVETCDTAGILGTAVNLAASLQVTEALKILTRQHHLLRRTLLSFDLWPPTGTGGIDKSEINTARPNPNCIVCGQRIFSHLAGEGRPHITLCGRNSVQIHEHSRPIDFAILRDRLALHSDLHDLRYNDLLLRFRRGQHTITVFADGRAIIQGTTDTTYARTLYARFIGS